jgi:serine/threonine-protein kinase RsbW
VKDVRALCLRNDLAEVARLMSWLDSLANEFELPSGTAHALQLCLHEWVVNVLDHAFEPDTSHHLRVSVWRDNVLVHAEVSDDGRAFDPLAYVPPATAKTLETATPGHLGIKLIRGFAERLAYRRCQGMNRLEMSFALA